MKNNKSNKTETKRHSNNFKITTILPQTHSCQIKYPVIYSLRLITTFEIS